MRTIIFLVFITVNIFSILSVPSYSINWLEVETSIKWEKFYIDLDSVEYDGPIVTFWAKDVDRKQEETKTRYSINCTKGRGAIRDIILFDSDGTVLKSWSGKDKKIQWLKITPDSFMSSFQKILCKEM